MIDGRCSIFLRATFLLLLAAPSAHAVCGDVDGSGAVSVTDALAVLRSATGLSVNLVCDEVCEFRASRIRLRNDWTCTSGSSTAVLRTSTGESLSAGGNGQSGYLTFDHDEVAWVEWIQCGDTIRFDGPFTVPRERKMRIELLALDPYFISGNPNDLFWYLDLIDEGPRP